MSIKFSRVAVAVAAAAFPLLGSASSHREAPNITRMPTVDSTDVFMFMSYEPGREGYVTLIADYYPFQEPFGGPNYYALDDAAIYQFNIDNTGDLEPDLVFSFTFRSELGGTDRGGARLDVGGRQIAVPLKNVGPVSAADTSALNFRESYQLKVTRITNGDGVTEAVNNAADGSPAFTKPHDFIGTKTFGSVDAYESYARQYIYEVKIPGCQQPAKVFVGQRREPFSVNVGKIFDLVNLVPIEAGAFPGGITQDPKNNVIGDKNISTLALEVHSSCLTGSGNGVIGGWTSARLPQARVLAPNPDIGGAEVNGGPFLQVSRLGMPLVNELVIGLPDKDRFNASRPAGDARYLGYVTRPTLPALLNVLFRDPVNQALGQSIPNLAPSNLPRNDLVAAFLTGFSGVNQLKTVAPGEMQRLNTTVPAVAAANQKPLGVLDGDLAGFPNGRRPGDDVTDAELRVAMGRLCYPLTINGASVDLGLCRPSDAPVGNVPFTDGAPRSAADFDTRFPYLVTPLPGSADLPALTAR